MSTGIGIDVGGTKILAVLGTTDGKILSEYQVMTCRGRNGFLEQIHEIVDNLLSKSGTEMENLDGIGVGLPGIVNRKTGAIKWVPNLPELNGLDLYTPLASKWCQRIELKNDGHLALMGEHWVGAAQNCSNVVMLTVGTGIGGAIMLNGRLIEGSHGVAGSMGWMTMDLNDNGNSELGWFERMVSGTAINRRAKDLPAPLDSYKLFETWREWDHAAEGLVRNISYCLGAGVANLVSIVDPEVVIVGGGVASLLDLLLPEMRKAVKMYASPLTRDVPIIPAKLGNRAGVLGALHLAFNPEI